MTAERGFDRVRVEVLLGLLREMTRRHVFDHALAQRAAGKAAPIGLHRDFEANVRGLCSLKTPHNSVERVRWLLRLECWVL